jgi:hypothetical protein
MKIKFNPSVGWIMGLIFMAFMMALLYSFPGAVIEGQIINQNSMQIVTYACAILAAGASSFNLLQSSKCEFTIERDKK